MTKGIIILNKPKGLTSHDCVARLRRKTGIKKIGHTGTLDPQATGVLPMCIGNATRMIEYLEHDQKTYLCELIFGITTDSYDIWGTETPGNSQRSLALERLDLDSILNVLPKFRGNIEQKPPIFSAIRKNGKRLYEYARKGEEIEIPTRRVTIYQLELIDFDKTQDKAKLLITCSKGTYIRSICNDIGDILDCGAVMSALERTRCGNMDIEDSVSLENLEESQDYKVYLKPMWYPLTGLGEIKADFAKKEDLINGKKIKVDSREIVRKPSNEEQKDLYGVLAEGELWAIGKLTGETFKSEKVFLNRESD